MNTPLHVLIVEDNEDDALLLLEELRCSGYEPVSERVYSAAAMRKALHHQSWDLVISDYSMPQFCGSAALAVLKESGLDLPFIIVSGAIGEETAVSAMKAGAHDYIQKDNLTRLVPAIERELREAEIRREQKQTKKALDESEEFHRVILTNISDAVFITNNEGQFVYVGPNVDYIFGYSKEEVWNFGTIDKLLGSNLYTISELEQQNEIRNIEREIIDKNGDSHFVLINVKQVSILDGTNLFTCRDVTERKIVLDALKESEQRLIEAQRIAQLGHWEWHIQTGHLYWSDEIYRIFGLNHQIYQPTYDSFLKKIHPEDREMVQQAVNSALAEQHRYSIDHRIILSTGEIRIVHEEGKTIFDENSIAVRMIGTIQDITEFKNTERQVNILTNTVEQTADDVVITDVKGNILYINPSFEKMTGYTKEEVIGQNPRILKSGKHDKEFYDILWTTITAGDTFQDVFINKKKNGELYYIEKTISPLKDPQGNITHFVATGKNITERVKAEQEKAELEGQLRQSQKMEAIGRLAGGIAHDFNNLLTVINGYSDILLNQTPPNSPMKKHLENIAGAGERASTLVRQLLAFSRKQIIQPRPVNINQIVEDMEKILRRLIGEDIEFAASYDHDLGEILADPGQIEQVIMNIVVNARDAMPNGGSLTLETTTMVLSEEMSWRHMALNPGKYACLSISDTGCGMDKTTQSLIFEPFFTTKEEGKGTGLGLATVYGIVKQAGGDIYVYSELDKGTIFKIYFPFHSPVHSGELSNSGPEIISNGTETILVVEDEDSVRALACNVLKVRGYTVLEAASGEEALQIASRYNKHIHLAVTDVVMPQMSGREFVDRLLEIKPDVNVLYMSGYTDEIIAPHGVLSDETHFLEKPFTPAKLAAKVREVLENPHPVLVGT